jgi:hypothetical protein
MSEVKVPSDVRGDGRWDSVLYEKPRARNTGPIPLRTLLRQGFRPDPLNRSRV